MKIDHRQFVGLDLECSGASLQEGHRLIQIGLAVTMEDGSIASYCSKVWIPPETPWNAKAARVHNIPREDLFDAPDPATVQKEAATFLMDCLGDLVTDDDLTLRERSILAVGWNCAGFDLPFLQAQMPALAAAFSYRSVDLNAPLFTFSMASGRSFNGMKKKAKTWAAEQIAGESRFHDAGFDSLAHLYAWQYMKDNAQELATPEKEWRAQLRTEKHAARTAKAA